MRTGIGYDIHKLVSGRKLILGGVEIPYEKGLSGHSDADVLTHAIIDALLGAAGLGDIGKHFPDSDPQWKDADSLKLLEMTNTLIKEKKFNIGNIDCIVIAEMPKLQPHTEKMKTTLANVLGISMDKINIKSKTNEGLGEIGEQEAIAAWANALITQSL